MFLPVAVRAVVFVRGRVDFRKRFDGLLAESYALGRNPYAGDCMVFVDRYGRQVRCLVGDSLGLYLVCRRFEGGALKNLMTKTELTESELAMLLQGASFVIRHQVKPWK